ncbi:MAG: hypothetical protein HZA52_19255 [Planctomycetes bacterium]|nr:hypothetical protein [Planctomycetota bacterium]
MLRPALAITVLLTTVSVASVGAQTTLTLDQAIDRLPRDGAGGHWDDRTRKWVHEPAVDVVREHVADDDLSDEQWRRAIARTGVLRWRDAWPVGTEFAVSMRRAAWLDTANLTLLPRVRGWRLGSYEAPAPGLCALAYDVAASDADYQELGAWPERVDCVLADLIVDRGPYTFPIASEQPLRVWSGTFELRVRQVESFDAVVAPVQAEELDRAVADALTVTFDTARHSDPPMARAAFLEFRSSKFRPAEFEGIAASLAIDVLRDGVLVSSVQGPVVRLDDPEEASATVVAALPPSIEHDEAESARFCLRVRGSDHGLLGVWDASRRWRGSVTIPVATLVARGRR